MESSSNHHQENPNPNPSSSFLPSPNSLMTNSSSSSSSNSNAIQLIIPPPSTPPPSQLLLHSPKPITRSEPNNPYPTTFVQADSSSFKQVVQMLTGSPETAKQATVKPAAGSNSDSASKTHIPPIKSLPKRQQSGFKLYERRNSLNKLKINPLIPVFGSNNSGFSPRKPEILSPSILDFPALALSPVTPLIPDPFDRSGLGNYRYGELAEEKAIKEKGFFLHPSPTTTPRDSEPRLLPLFPTTSPRVPGSTSTS